VWRVTSSSDTVYYVDCDRRALLRGTGRGSSRGHGDDRWVPLLQVRAMVAGDTGVIRVGDRHEYTFDADPLLPDCLCWLQRVAVSITHVDDAELATLPGRLPGGAR